jgi:hypothetical protein
LDETWCFALFGGAAWSGAMIAVLSGAASTTFDGSPAAGNAVAAESDSLAAADAGTASPELTVAMGSADVVWAAAGAAVFGNTAAVDAAGVGAAMFAAGSIAGWVGGVVREDTRAEVSGLSLGGAAATEAGGDAGFAGAVIVAGAADGTAAARTLVTIARAATGVCSGSFGRSTRESTTPAPAVAPIAVATKITRAVRAKLGVGAK